MVGDAHVPAAAAPDVVAADALAVDPPEEVDEDEPPDELLADEGDVGSKRLVLFENWQPVSRTDAAIITVTVQMFLIMARYTLVSAHTILLCASDAKP